MGRTVRLIGVPVDLYLRAANHQAELAREFALIAFGDKSGMTTHEVPTRLLDIVDELRHRYGRPSDDIRALFEHAAARGERTVDLELPDDDVVADLTERVTAILDDADEFCRSGHLLTLAAPPEVIAWRHWWRDQVVDQIRGGAEPSPFPHRADA